MPLVEEAIASLVTKFDRFYKSLYATTVPHRDGRMVAGVSHAIALAEATTWLTYALGTAVRAVVADYRGDNAQKPPRGGRITPLNVGGMGIDANLMAALESAMGVVAFPSQRHNAMTERIRERIRRQPPEDRIEVSPLQRWHNGEVIPQAQLDKLDSARALLKLAAGLPPAGADECEEGEQAPPLTPTQATVLATMDKYDGSLLLSAETIEAKMDECTRLSKRTIGPILKKLVQLDLAERPEGPRSGARLTRKGRKLANKIAD